MRMRIWSRRRSDCVCVCVCVCVFVCRRMGRRVSKTAGGGGRFWVEEKNQGAPRRQFFIVVPSILLRKETGVASGRELSSLRQPSCTELRFSVLMSRSRREKEREREG